MKTEKKICQNPLHPFKQKWYMYDPGFKSATSSPEYCSSCASRFDLVRMIIREAIMRPSPTLYGMQMLPVSADQVAKIAHEIEDGKV